MGNKMEDKVVLGDITREPTKEIKVSMANATQHNQKNVNNKLYNQTLVNSVTVREISSLYAPESKSSTARQKQLAFIGSKLTDLSSKRKYVCDKPLAGTLLAIDLLIVQTCPLRPQRS